ncbi:zinc-binding alcohol dehydrogenase family protein, partial [Calditrichota bacterium]
YIGINFAEILSRKGLYGWAPKRPYVLGMEGSGIITDVGEGVDKTRIGQQVMVGTQYGCYAEKLVVPQERAIPTVENYTMPESAAFLVNYMTAWMALFELAKIKKNEKVLITAAAGGVGTAAIQLAEKFSCQVFGLAGSQDKIEFIKNLGATEGFNYREKNCFDKLCDLTGGVDVVVEMVGGRVYKESFKLLNPLGRMSVIGFASLDINWWNPLSWWRTLRDIPRMKIMDLAEKSAGIMASHLGYLLKQPKLMQAILERLIRFVTDKQIKPVIGKTFPFDKVAAAHEFIELRKSMGKVLLEIE